MKVIIHGGAPGAWENSWSYRRHAELFGANGYVVIMVNFHRWTGYGQKFTDSISGDWGGKPYVDLMKGLDYVEKTYPFIDKNREAALGASYGGFIGKWVFGCNDPFQWIMLGVGAFFLQLTFRTTEGGCGLRRGIK